MRVPLLVATLLDGPQYRKATYYPDEKTVVKLTRQHRQRKNAPSHNFVLTFGKPNYAESRFIHARKKAGDGFPLEIQLQKWPVKRPKKGKK